MKEELLKNFLENKRSITNFDEAYAFFEELRILLEKNNYVLTPDDVRKLISETTNFSESLSFLIKDLMSNYNIKLKTKFYDELFLAYVLAKNSLQEAKNIPMLSDESSIDSLKLYLYDIREFPLLSQEEEKIIAILNYNGNQKAKKILIERNLRLVVFIAKRYLNRGLDFLDLIEEGNMGLMRAVQDFNPYLEYRFSSYATFKIRGAIFDALMTKTRMIRVPRSKLFLLRRYLQLKDDYYKEFGQELSIEEAKARLGLEEWQYLELKNIYVNSEPLELDRTIDSENDDTFLDMLDSFEKGFEDIEKINLEEIFEMCNLSSSEAYIIREMCTNNKTLEAISKELHLSSQRIVQKKSKALRKLRVGKTKIAAYLGLISSSNIPKKAHGLPLDKYGLTPLESKLLVGRFYDGKSLRELTKDYSSHPSNELLKVLKSALEKLKKEEISLEQYFKYLNLPSKETNFADLLENEIALNSNLVDNIFMRISQLASSEFIAFLTSLHFDKKEIILIIIKYLFQIEPVYKLGFLVYESEEEQDMHLSNIDYLLQGAKDFLDSIRFNQEELLNELGLKELFLKYQARKSSKDKVNV